MNSTLLIRDRHHQHQKPFKNYIIAFLYKWKANESKIMPAALIFFCVTIVYNILLYESVRKKKITKLTML